ncbi:hypothetical protein CFP56_039310 [Quercus suber]|uniref:Uncharacterized protein n=1 Tax=Quercus suber TaxID=58331 RepID=A0AAW0J094_QUESU
MEVEVTTNLEQPSMIVKEKDQTAGQSETNNLGVSQPSTNELKCNVQSSINCEAELQSQTERDINCGVEYTFKIDMNSEPLIDPQQHDFQLHSITINTQLVIPPNYEGSNTQLKENNSELKTQDSSKTTDLFSRKQKITCHQNRGVP